MEEINLFSENKSHLKQLGEQLLLASDEAKQTQVRGSLQELNQRWHNLFHHIEARWGGGGGVEVDLSALKGLHGDLKGPVCNI